MVRSAAALSDIRKRGQCLAASLNTTTTQQTETQSDTTLSSVSKKKLAVGTKGFSYYCMGEMRSPEVSEGGRTDR